MACWAHETAWDNTKWKTTEYIQEENESLLCVSGEGRRRGETQWIIWSKTLKQIVQWDGTGEPMQLDVTIIVIIISLELVGNRGWHACLLSFFFFYLNWKTSLDFQYMVLFKFSYWSSWTPQHLIFGLLFWLNTLSPLLSRRYWKEKSVPFSLLLADVRK